MVSLYSVSIWAEFAAAHRLRDYPGECDRLHGHNWKVEVKVVAPKLDEAGMVIDFKRVKQATKQIAEVLDHRYLNEIAPFTHMNPTAENISAYFFHGLTEILNDERIKIQSVTIWETERACATYSEGH